MQRNRLDTRELLIRARRLIADPEAWTQGVMARDAAGELCSPRNRRAVKRCAVGAVMAVANEHDGSQIDGLRALRRQTPDHMTVGGFNDSTEHASVLWLYDRAIEAA